MAKTSEKTNRVEIKEWSKSPAWARFYVTVDGEQTGYFFVRYDRETRYTYPVAIELNGDTETLEKVLELAYNAHMDNDPTKYNDVDVLARQEEGLADLAINIQRHKNDRAAYKELREKFSHIS